MFKHYVILMLRNLRKFKQFALINILGFSICISLALFAIFCIFNELQYDNFHPNSQNIYRITSTLIYQDGVESDWARVMPWVGPNLKSDMPEVEAVATFMTVDRAIVELEDNKFKEENVLAVDSSFFEVFGFELILGNKSDVLTKNMSVVLTSKTAKKYLGNENPIGKTIMLNGQLHTVTGVVNKGKRNSHFSFDMLVFSPYLNGYWKEYDDKHHRLMFVYTYIKLKKGIVLTDFKTNLASFTKKYLTKNDIEEAKLKDWTLDIQPITKIHIGSMMKRELEENIQRSTFYLITAVTLILILIACINYVVLMAAIYTYRKGEIGIQKILGAGKRNLVTQFIGESISFIFVSILLAIIFLRLEILWFGNLFYDRALDLNIFFDPYFLLILFGLTISIGIVGGIYPIFSMGNKKIITFFNKNKTSKLNKTFLLRLMGVQLLVSILILSFTFVILKQLNYFKNKDHGFDKDRLIVLDLPYNWEKYDAFKLELLKLPSVTHVTKALNYPGGYIEEVVTSTKNGGSKLMTTNIGCEDYIETMGFEIIKGRDFLLSDDWEGKGIILNESALDDFGWENPIGQKVHSVEARGDDRWNYTVVGIIKDFHNFSFHKKIEPTRLHMVCWRSKYIIIKTKDQKSKYTAIHDIEKVWNQMNSNEVFNYKFLEDVFYKLYKNESQLAIIFSIFSFIAILISIIGVVGIASMTVKSRLREIGIRKVFGASILSVYKTVSKGFFIIIGVICIISIPLIYYINSIWLEKFEYKISLGFDSYLFPILIVVISVWVVISYYIVKSASINPIKVLKEE